MSNNPEELDLTKYPSGAEPGDVTPPGYDQAPNPNAYPAQNSPYAVPQSTPAGYNQDSVQNGYQAPQQYAQSPYGVPQGHQPASGSNDFTENWKRPDNLSMIYAVGSLVSMLISTFFGFFWAVAIVGAILGLVEAKKAKAQGLDYMKGQVLSWVAIGASTIGFVIILGAIALLLFGFVVFG